MMSAPFNGKLGSGSATRAVGFLLGLLLGTRGIQADPPPMQVKPLADGRIELSWVPTGGNLLLEQANAVGETIDWQIAADAPVEEAGRLVVRTQPAGAARFYRLREILGALVTVESTSPRSGEGGIAVTRETVFNFTAPLATGSLLSTGSLRAVAGGLQVLSRAELSDDRRRATLFYLENLPPGTQVTVTFDGAGLTDEGGRVIDLDGDRQSGGTVELTFDTANSAPLANTAIVGRVLASEPGAGGADVPLGGVTITVDGMEETLRTTTAADGTFRLMPCPTGRFFVNVDGRTATASQWPAGPYYPVIGKAWEATVGKTNNLAGGSGVIYLPLVAAGTLQSVSATTETRITFPPAVIAANPALAGVEIMVPANGLFADNGVRGGLVGLAPVASDRLPEPLPAGLNHALDISIQTSGPQNFTGLVPAKFPNLPDPITGLKLPPGAKTALWSFNHDTGRWEMQGPMTISDDGNFAVTDPGVGIRQPGWHGTSPGSSGGGGPGGGGGGCPDGSGGGQLLEEGTSGGGGNCDCPDEPAKAKQKAQECFARAAECALKCYEKCGTPETITKWWKVLTKSKDCVEAAMCSKKCSDDAKKCQDHWQKCLLGSGGFRLGPNARHALGDDPVIAEAQRILADNEVRIERWEALGVILDRAPSFEELSAADQAAALLIWGELQALYGDQAPPDYAVEQLRRLSQLVLQSPFSDEIYPPASGYYAIEDLQSGLVRRGRTEPRGIITGLILRPDTTFRIRLLLGPALRFHDQTFVSAGAGQPTFIPYGDNVPFPAVDADGDGIPADGEFVLGTRDDRADSDGDGVEDLDELKNHTDPLDGAPAANGVIASLNTPGNAQDIAPLNQLMLVADGSAGLAVVEVTDPLRPKLLQQLDTPGDALGVAAEGTVAAVADGTRGLALVDLLNPGSPVLYAQLALGGVTRAVALQGGVAYAGMQDGTVVAVDVVSGTERTRVSLPGGPKIEDLAVQGDLLYVWAAGTLHVLNTADGGLDPIATVPAGVGGGFNDRRMRLTLSPGRAYAAYPAGVVVFDLSNPAAPALLQKRNTAQNGWKQLVPALPNLALAVDGLNLVNDEPQDVSLYGLGPDGTELNFLGGFVTPGVSLALTLNGGLAFLADGAAGLQVINFAPADTAGVPPTLSLAADFSLNPPQIESGQRGRVTALAGDDVLVRQVEFFLNDVRVAVDTAWPFELALTAPERTVAVTSFRLRVRAVDTGGNATELPEVTVAVLPDQTPPRVISLAPRPDSVADGLTSVTAFFSEPLDFQSVTAAHLRLLSAGPDLVFGNADDGPLTGTAGYSATGLAATLTLAAPLPPGRYRFEVDGLVDLAGNAQAVPRAASFYVAPGGPGGDPDGDGLTNGEESTAGSSPFALDTDGDGWADEVEVHDGRDPRDPASHPQALVYALPPLQTLLADPAEVLPAVPGPVVAHPPVSAVILPQEELAAAGPYVAHPPVETFIASAAEDAPAGPFVARPPVELFRESDSELAPPGPWIGLPPISILRLPENEAAPAGPYLGRPPVQVLIPKP